MKNQFILGNYQTQGRFPQLPLFPPSRLEGLSASIPGRSSQAARQYQQTGREASPWLTVAHTHTQNAAYSGRDFKPSFSPKFFRENRME